MNVIIMFFRVKTNDVKGHWRECIISVMVHTEARNRQTEGIAWFAQQGDKPGEVLHKDYARAQVRDWISSTLRVSSEDPRVRTFLIF